MTERHKSKSPDVRLLNHAAMEYFYGRPEDIGSEEDFCEDILRSVLVYAWDAFRLSEIAEQDMRFLNPNVVYSSEEYDLENVKNNRELDIKALSNLFSGENQRSVFTILQFYACDIFCCNADFAIVADE